MTRHPMLQLLGVKQLSHPTQVRLDGAPLVPRAPFTTVAVRWWRVLCAHAPIGQGNRLTIIPQRERSQGSIGCIGGGPGPVDHGARIVDQPGPCATANPAPMRRALLANLLRAASFAARLDQRAARGVADGKERWLRKPALGHGRLVAQQPQQARTFGQAREERSVVAIAPAIERPIAATLACKQQADGDAFTRTQLGIRSIVDALQFIVYHTKQADDKLVRGPNRPPVMSL